jgi:hypothetical protein
VGERAATAPAAPPVERSKRTAPPWVVAAIVAVAYALLIIPRLSGGDAYGFIHVGHMFLTRSDTSSVIRPSLGYESKVGYDGQFYFFVAADPSHASDYMESPGFIYSRIVYPMVVRVLSGGKTDAIPYLMILVNAAAAIGGTLLVAMWLKRRRLSTGYALLYGFFPGLIFAVFRDLTEPLAYGLAAAAVLVFEPRSPRRLAASAALFAVAALTRETVLLFPAVLALSLLVGNGASRSWSTRVRVDLPRAAAFGAAVLAPLFAWRLFLSIWLSAPTQESAGAGGPTALLLPFHGMAAQWPWSRPELLVLLTVVLPAIAYLAVAVAALRRRATANLWILVANIVVFVIFVPDPIDVDYGAAGRAAIGVVLAALLALPECKAALGGASRTIRYSLTLWSLPYYFFIAALLGAPGPGLLR